jgi:hypothetical protein
MSNPVASRDSDLPSARERHEPLENLETSPALAADDLDRLEQEIAALQQNRAPPPRDLIEPLPAWLRRFEPELLSPPPARRDFTFGFFARIGIVVLAVSVGALIAFGKIPANGWRNAGAEIVRLVTAVPPGRAAPRTRSAILPALVLEGSTAESGDVIPLGVKVSGSAAGAVAVIAGLAAGTTLTAGQASGANWLVPAAELPAASIRPPAGFAGTMEYTIELQLADGTLADRQAMILDWPEIVAEPRQIDADELALLLTRGQSLLETGDLAAARLLLRRAAESGNARAAFALAATYDPLVLKEIGALGLTPDLALARAWYEKAKEYGSREAPRRLELLASQGR